MPRVIENEYNFPTQPRASLNYDALFDGRTWRLEHGSDFGGTPRFCAGRLRKAARARNKQLQIHVGANFIVLRAIGTLDATRVQPATTQQPQTPTTQQPQTVTLPPDASARNLGTPPRPDWQAINAITQAAAGRAFSMPSGFDITSVTQRQRRANEAIAMREQFGQQMRSTAFDVTPAMREASRGRPFFIWHEEDDDVHLLVMDAVPLAIPLRQEEAAELHLLLVHYADSQQTRDNVFARVTQFTRHLLVRDGWHIVHLNGTYYSRSTSGEHVPITEVQAAYMVACQQYMRVNDATPQFIWRDGTWHATVQGGQPAFGTATPCDAATPPTTPAEQAAAAFTAQLEAGQAAFGEWTNAAAPQPPTLADAVQSVIDSPPTPPRSTATRRTTTSTTTTQTPTTPMPAAPVPTTNADDDARTRRRELLQRRTRAAADATSTTTSTTTTPAEATSDDATSDALRQYTNREHRPADALLQAGQRWVWDGRLGRWCVRAQRRGPSGS